MRNYIPLPLIIAASIIAAPSAFAQTAPAPAAPAVTAPAASANAMADKPEAPKSIEERVAALEAQMAKVVEDVNTIAENAASIDAARGLARDVVSLQDQITEIKRATIPAPKTSASTKVTADKPAKPATPPKK